MSKLLKKSTIIGVAVLLVILLSIAGCSANATKRPTSTALTPAAVEEASPTGAVAAPNKTITPLPPSPKATLAPQESRTEIFHLLETNGGCEFPCLWGITPGITSSAEINSFLNQFEASIGPPIGLGVYPNKNSGLLSFFSVEGNMRIDLSLDYSLKGDTINLIGFVADPRTPDGNTTLFGDPHYNSLFSYFMLPQVLSNYGPPAEVLIKARREALPPGPHPFSLVLFYPEKGFLAEYTALQEVQNGKYLGCPSKAFVNFRFFPPDAQRPLAEIADWGAMSGLGITSTNTQSFKSIEEATGLTNEEFYKRFKNPDSEECIETPIDIWPLQQ